ncbi:MAG: hypothetical protein ACUVRU_10995 [Anaerolineae bacterium]
MKIVQHSARLVAISFIALILSAASHIALKPALLTVAQANPLARIIAPSSEQSIRGNVTIQGTANSSQFVRYEVAYAAEPDLAAWIVIGGGAQPVENGVLAVWNTRPLPEGAYALRVQVVNADGSVFEGFVRNLKIANAGGQPTPSAPAGAGQPDEATSSAEADAGGAEASEFDLAAIPAAFMRGARIALLAFAALGAYVALKRVIGLFLRRLFDKPVDYGR